MSTDKSAASFLSRRDRVLADYSRNRNLLSKIRIKDRWRGGVGLAVMVNIKKVILGQGNYDIYRNEDVTWATLRDIPVGHLRTGRGHASRPGHFAAIAQAKLKYGMPGIDFSEVTNWDLWECPRAGNGQAGQAMDLDRVRECEVFNALNAQLTRAAVFGMVEYAPNKIGPLRRSLLGLRDQFAASFSPKSFRLADMPELPRPYRAFPAEKDEQVYSMCTEAEQVGEGLCCSNPDCQRMVDIEFLLQPRQPDGGRQPARLTEKNDRFFAVCPYCHRDRVWHWADAEPNRVVRKFTYAFRVDFCDAVADGLPLRLREAGTYLGNFEAGDVSEEGVMRLSRHQFKHEDGTITNIFTPSRVQMKVRPGEWVKADQHWVNLIDGQSLGDAGDLWLDMDDKDRWANLRTVCQGGAHVGLLQKLWFESKAKYVLDSVLFPAAYCTPSLRELADSDLYWVFDSVDADYYNRELAAYVFPVIPLKRWDALRFSADHRSMEVNCNVAGLPAAERRTRRLSDVEVNGNVVPPPEVEKPEVNGNVLIPA